MSIRQKLIAIVGPTASGKSELAVKLAKHFNGEIISADSRQVYRGLDIGTGKVEGKWSRWQSHRGSTTSLGGSRDKITTQNSEVFTYKNIPHYCIDFVDPKKQYTVAEFKHCADEAIRDITDRGKTPILVGGTGFWIDAVAQGTMLPEVPPDMRLRRKLENKSAAELFKILKKLDSKRAVTIDPKNPRRLIRAIEIAHALGQVPLATKKSPYRTLWIGIRIPDAVLKKRIRVRLQQWWKSGLVREIQHLKKQGVRWKRFHELGFDYHPIAEYLRKKITAEKAFRYMESALYHYVKRQRTWFRRNRRIHWIQHIRDAEKLARQFLKK